MGLVDGPGLDPDCQHLLPPRDQGTLPILGYVAATLKMATQGQKGSIARGQGAAPVKLAAAPQLRRAVEGSRLISRTYFFGGRFR